jgi:hypothetical protein
MYQWAGRLAVDGLDGKEHTGIIMIIAFVNALVAAAGLGVQFGFRRGVRLAAQRTEADAIATAIIRIAANKPLRGKNDAALRYRVSTAHVD